MMMRIAPEEFVVAKEDALVEAAMGDLMTV